MSAANGRVLLDHHKAMLKASAVDDDVAEQRGYFSVQTQQGAQDRVRLRTHAATTPALVIPIHSVVKGEQPWYDHRPDTPPIKDARHAST